MLAELIPALRLFMGLTLLTGFAYPLATTGIAQALFRSQAHGSLIEIDGEVRGSTLIGQSMTLDRYFIGRPSAAGAGYDAASSGATNFALTRPDWITTVIERARAVQQRDGSDAPVPIELVTASGSGLDPHLTPPAAEYQLGRVARARGLPEARVRELVGRYTEPRLLGVFGETTVNLVELNLALDRMHARESRPVAPIT